MDLPAVTICSLSPVSRRKVFITDDDPLFESSGLNISLCAVTSGVRGNRPCGYSLLCAYAEMPNCSSQNQKDLLAVIQKSGHGFDVEKLYRTFSHDIGALMTPVFCQFGRNLEKCSAKDFVPMVTSSGMCYTFNSGTDGKVKTLDTAGVTNGFRVVLDAQSHDFFLERFSTGFKVIVHKQGEHINGLEGTNVGPGLHVVFALSEKKLKNLEKPFATNCTKGSLKTFSTYTLDGCLYECVAENVVKTCKCRLAGYKGRPEISVCTLSKEDRYCIFKIKASLDLEVCDCHVPCAETKYQTEVSYSKFPGPAIANTLMSLGYDKDLQYQRDNLMLLEIGFKSLSYELQEQQPAYDSNSLFGEIGGNMGLFLGCSLLTICEFFDFLVSFLAARQRQVIQPALS
ncbi:hypothetical protein ACROYT_G024772 [Oculina patagonica]